jgi:hypothetical protein
MSELLSQLEIVGHWEHDFDTGALLSGNYLYVTKVPFRPSVLYLVVPNGIQTQAIED